MIQRKVFFLISLAFSLLSCGNNASKNKPSISDYEIGLEVQASNDDLFVGIDSVVCLSFLGIELDDSISTVSSSKRIYQTTATSDEAEIYQMKKTLSLSGTSIPVDIEVSSVNGIICRIEGSISKDYSQLIGDTYIAKYGTPSSDYGSYTQTKTLKWRFRNQSVLVKRDAPQRVIWHPELKKDIYTRYYDFKRVLISYDSHPLSEVFDSLALIQTAENKRQQFVIDSIAAVREEEARIKAEEERRKELLKDANQI